MTDRYSVLTRAIGYGDGVTEPQADVETVIAAWEEVSRDAAEWREHEQWRVECYLAGHPKDEDCWEHDPARRLEAAESAVAAVRAVLAEHWDWKAGIALRAAVTGALEVPRG